MKTIAIVQARMGSTRLPNKVMKSIGGIPMIELLLSRLSRSKQIDQIIVATSVDERNLPLVEHVLKLGFADLPLEIGCWWWWSFLFHPSEKWSAGVGSEPPSPAWKAGVSEVSLPARFGLPRYIPAPRRWISVNGITGHVKRERAAGLRK